MALKEFFHTNDQFTLKLFEETDKLEKDLENICLSYKKFIDTGDPSQIISVIDDTKLKEKLTCIVPTKHGKRKKTVLNDITQELNLESLNIKQEKLTEIMESEQHIELGDIKQEKEDMMPPPMRAPPKKRKLKQELLHPDIVPKRSTRTRSRMKNNTMSSEESLSVRASDVIQVENTITTVDLDENSSSSKDKVQSEQEISARSTRSKTANKKRLVENGISNGIEDHIPSGVTFTAPQPNPLDQVVDDQSPNNATFTVTKGSFPNPTVVNENPKIKKPGNPKTENIPLRKKQTKEVFSPYMKTPLTKNDPRTPLSQGSAIKLKGACSTYKINRNFTGKVSSECLTNSGLKASQAEFREREKKRLEKEQEALRKKEALLQAQTEEKRKKREEKQLKAQQQREEYMEKEKLRFLETQKVKEERIKKTNAEKEEKLQKLKEEAEYKRMRVKMNKAKRPIYMTTPMPLLPTGDPYDSDDPNYKKGYMPEWCRDTKSMQYAMLYAGQTIKTSLFSLQTHTPNLQEIFEDIDPKELQRTSSAAWKSPPRYTFFSITQDSICGESERHD